MNITPGTLINGKYRIERVLGEGGMGIVVAARNERLGREVAIKFLHANLAQRPEVLSRFLHEAQAAVQLRHPNVVDALDVDADEKGTPFIVLEMLVGESLASLLARRRSLSFEETSSILLPAMEGVALAHTRGLVHRDIKPDNIFLHRDGRGALIPKVLDFGIAKAADATTNNTATASMLGTPLYMPPEQIVDSKRATSASDVWSMGVVWFECLAGVLPHGIDPGAPPFQVLTRIVNERPRSLGAVVPHLPAAVVAVIDRSLTADLGVRYRDMSEFARAIEAVRNVASGSTMAIGAGERISQPRAVAPTVAMDGARTSSVAPTLPLGASPVAAAMPTPFAATSARAAPSGSRAPLFVGLGIVAVLALLGVVGLALNSRSTPALVDVDVPTSAIASSDAPVATTVGSTHAPIAPLAAGSVLPLVAAPVTLSDPACRRVADTTGTPLNIRAGASGHASIIGTLDQGTIVGTAEADGQWTRLVTPITGWVWSAHLVSCDAACVAPADTTDLAQLASGLDIRFGAHRSTTEARCGETADDRRSDCLATIVDIRRIEGPTGIGDGPVQISYLRSEDALFEVFAQSDRPLEEVVADLEARLGPATRTSTVARWDQGGARLAVTAPGGRTSIRAFDRDRAAAYSEAARACGVGE